MTEFLQTYGSWIIFGLLLVLMFRMHAGGHGHGGVMHHDNLPDDSRQHNDQYIVEADPVTTPPNSDVRPPAHKHDQTHAGCH